MLGQNAAFTSGGVAFGADLPQRVVCRWAEDGFFESRDTYPNGILTRMFTEDDVGSHAILRAFRRRHVALRDLRPVEKFLRECDRLKLRDSQARLLLAPSTGSVDLLHDDQKVVELLMFEWC